MIDFATKNFSWRWLYVWLENNDRVNVMAVNGLSGMVLY